MHEIWKTVDKFPWYQISSFGRVRVCARTIKTTRYLCRLKARVFSTSKGKNCYPAVTLRNKYGDRREVRVHILVAEYFIGPKPGPRFEVNHLDGNIHNPHYKNLEWTTKQGNAIHARLILNKGWKKLDPKIIKNIRRDICDNQHKFRRKGGGGLYGWLAKKYNLHVTTIYAIRDGRMSNYV